MSMLQRIDASHKAIDFYFDFSSPYAYIASEWIDALAAQHGRTVQWQAILLGVVFQAAELRPPISHPIKGDYARRDFERSARHAGVPLVLPAKFPIATQNAARVFWWLNDTRGAAAASAWGRHCLRAYFTRGTDLSDASALRGAATDFGLAADEAEGVWNHADWKARLRTANESAGAAGVFGAPFFMIDGEPFWGNDRRAQIERWLERGPF